MIWIALSLFVRLHLSDFWNMSNSFNIPLKEFACNFSNKDEVFNCFIS